MEIQSFPVLVWQLCAVSLLAGLVHGVSGFGFPLISTPVVALFTDVRTAVVTTLMPNIVVNMISVARGGNWRSSLGLYWPVAIWVVVGTLLGTRLILMMPPEPLKLALAAMMVLYLKQDALKHMDWGAVNRHPRIAGGVFGLVGGIMSGAVNVALPPLIIYFTVIGLAPLAMTQILNLCFLAGRTTQLATLGGIGQMGADVVKIAAPAVAAAIAGVIAGGAIQSRISPAAWRLMIRGVLWLLAALLLLQSVVSLVRG